MLCLVVLLTEWYDIMLFIAFKITNVLVSYENRFASINLSNIMLKERERENEMVYLYTHRNPINIHFMCWIEWVGRCHVMNRIGMKIPAHSIFCAFQFGSQTIWHFGWINPTHWFMETAWRSRDCCQIRFHDPKSTLVRDGNNGCVLFDIQPYTVRRMSDYTKPIFMYFPLLELSFFCSMKCGMKVIFPSLLLLLHRNGQFKSKLGTISNIPVKHVLPLAARFHK